MFLARHAILWPLLLVSTVAQGDEVKGDADKGLPSIAEKIGDLAPSEGYFTIYRDAAHGKIWLQVEAWGEDFLYASGLSSGLGQL